MSTNNQAYTESDVQSRVGQARLEAGLQHLGEKMEEGFTRLEQKISNRDTKYEKLAERVDTAEGRIDKIYWLGGLAVTLGTPLMMALSKLVLGKFGF